ncbi:UNVERIFIED_CONTAM: hypothetical protein GTU68_007325 [Idotea baltica]|nr:hypothetical protein [Idotea baltica]
MKYKRILLKLSGEALLGDLEFGIDPKRVNQYTDEICDIMTNTDLQMAIVIGGGNIFRGMQASEIGIDRVSGDYMGMMATIMNGVALQNALERKNIKTRLLSALEINKVCEPYIKRRAARHLEKGKANPSMLNGIMVDYYGSMTALAQVSTINAQDARTLNIKPWEKSMLEPIEKALFAANLGITPQNDGENIRLNIPPMTEDRRKDLSKQAKAEGEHAKVSLRNDRKHAIDAIKKMVKDGLSEDMGHDAEAEIQKVTNGYGERVDKFIKAKETEIMSI